MALKTCAAALMAALVLPSHAAIADGSKGKDKPADSTVKDTPDCYSNFTWCTMPYLNHAVVLFGDGHATKPTYATDAHTIGNSGSGHVRGVAINGPARFARDKSQTIYGTRAQNNSVVTGDIRGAVEKLTFQDGLVREMVDFEDLYNQDAWRQFALDLWAAKQAGDQVVKRRVRFYHPERDYDPETVPEKDRVMIIKRDSPDYVSAGKQVLHVMIGRGRLRADDDQNNKIDGAIIAPDGDVQLHRRWQHLHGFVVARTMREWWRNYPSDTGLQIHGQFPTGITCQKDQPEVECGDETDDVCPDAVDDKNWCEMPNLEHAVVAFGTPSLTNDLAINVDAHTMGNHGAETDYVQGAAAGSNFKIGATTGVAVDGHSIFGGVAVQVQPNFNGGFKDRTTDGAEAFAAMYNVDAWVKYVEDLFDAHARGDPNLSVEKGGRVHFYEVEEGEIVYLDVSARNLDSGSTTQLHVVRGDGKVKMPCRTADGDVAKVFGSIIAPEARVVVEQCDVGSYIDGYVVSKYIVEGLHHANSGFQIHGRIPKGIDCTCGAAVKPGCEDVDSPCAQPELMDEGGDSGL